MNIASVIINWYQKNKRDLPWRDTRDPYKIWLSEIIMQQTRVEQGLPYYNKFTGKYSTISQLAKASEDEVLKLWQGLGYYSRARNLHATAREVVRLYKGKFPSAYEDILKLKGIGKYTAAAIASFAFDLSYPVLDGNVARVISRYYGIDAPVDDESTKKEIYIILNELIKSKDPAIFNQAMMEFGSVQCKPGVPDCITCPLSATCIAYTTGRVSLLPVKNKKGEIKRRYFNYLFIIQEGKTYLQQRTGKGIWQNLYEFPLIETTSQWNEKKLLKSEAFGNLVPASLIKKISFSEIYEHKLSHQTIMARFIRVEVKKNYKLKKNSIFDLNLSALKSYAIPRLIDLYLNLKKK